MYFATSKQASKNNINRTTVNEREREMEFNVGDCLQHTFAREGNALKEFFFLFLLFFVSLFFCSPHKIRSLLSEKLCVL